MARIGATLRDARLTRGLSIEQVAQDTRISARFLEALEDEQFDLLPAPVYVRGFLRSYANYLRVEPAPLLAQLDAGGPGAPRIAGPESFVGGPVRPRDPFQRVDPPARADPFARPPPPPPPRQPIPPPPLATFDEDDAWGAAEPDDGPEFEDAYDQQSVGAGPPLVGRPRPQAPAGGFQYPQEETFRTRRMSGVLLERESAPNATPSSVRLLAIAGVAVFALLVIAALGILLFGGGGDNESSAVAAGDTPTRGRGTEISLRSPSPGASGTPSPSASPGAASPSPTGTAGTPTPTPTAPGGTPTATPTPAEPTATPTQAPPTPTPTPPSPTATPTEVVVQLPGKFSECPGGNCGPAPYRIVCSPTGFFVDNPEINGIFPLSGNLYERTAPTLSQADNVCFS